MMKLQTTNYELSTKNFLGFTLIELMIVVSILGILGAIVLPEFQSQSQQTKESTAKTNLKILRETIDRYALDHNGTPPGYDTNNTALATFYFKKHLVRQEIYLTKIPTNSFNNLDTIKGISSTDTFEPDNSTGWLYQYSTKIIKLNYTGTDSEGVAYSNY